MLEVKPSKKWNIGMLFLAIPVVLLMYYWSQSLFVSGAAMILAIVGTFLNSKSKISLDNRKLTYVTFLTKKIISIEDIGLIELRSGPKQVILVFSDKNDRSGKKDILCIYNIAIYRNADLKKLLDEIVKIRPTIVISVQAKNFVEGKFYTVTSFRDA